MKPHAHRRKPARGEWSRGHKLGHRAAPRLSVIFDPDVFRRLVAEAGLRQVPLATVVREKVAAGLGAPT